MVDLDNIDLNKMDPGKIAEQLRSLPDDLRRAWAEVSLIQVPDDYIGLKKIVLIGMGGSGAANDSIKEIVFSHNAIVETVHDYTLPGYTAKDTLTIISSYSGNTEETLNCFNAALAARAKIFVITTGGQLAELAKQHNVPSFIFNYPSQPRMATPYLFTPLLSIFEKIGAYELPDSFESICDEVALIIPQNFPETPEAQNSAKQLAKFFYTKVPIIYSSTLLRAIAMRLKNQINENSKQLAVYDYLPELNHNTIEGYVNWNANVYIALLQSNFENDRVKLRQEITSDILSKTDIPHSTITFPLCSNSVSEHLVMASFGDAVSFYLAVLNGTDPTAIPNINYLKSKL